MKAKQKTLKKITEIQRQNPFSYPRYIKKQYPELLEIFPNYKVNEIIFLLKHNFNKEPQCLICKKHYRKFYKENNNLVLLHHCNQKKCKFLHRKKNNHYQKKEILIKNRRLRVLGYKHTLEELQQKYQDCEFSDILVYLKEEYSDPPICAYCNTLIRVITGKQNNRRVADYCEKIECRNRSNRITKKYCKASVKGSEGYFKRTGYKWPTQNPEVRKKIIKSNLERYGCENVMHNNDIFLRQQESTYRCKKCLLPSGRLIKYQGYELIAFEELCLMYKENDIIMSMDGNVPSFNYNYNNRVCVYYPDIFIPKGNLIIEVKSDYTFSIDEEKNMLKKHSVKKAGFDFKFFIYSKNSLRVDIE